MSSSSMSAPHGAWVNQEGGDIRLNINPGNNNKIHVGNKQTNFYGDRKRDNWERIPYAAGAAWDDRAQQASRCVMGTRHELLQQIKDWAGSSTEHRTFERLKTRMRKIGKIVPSNLGSIKGVPVNKKIGFWLGGLAGTGKSTVARTIAEDLSKGRDCFTVASFFFRRGTTDRANTSKFVTTVLQQIARQEDSLKRPLLQAFENHGSQQMQLASAWNKLIKTPLAESKHRTILLVLDAIDESRENMGHAYEMFDLLSDASNFEGLDMRVLVTARPHEQVVYEDLHDVFYLHDVPEDVVERDLRIFFDAKFGENELDRRRVFPTSEQKDALAKRSAPLFIAAMTSYRFITEHGMNPQIQQSQYDILMSSETKVAASRNAMDQYHDLDNTYVAVILRGLALWMPYGPSANTLEAFKSIMGSTITMREPFSVRELAVLLSRETDQVRAMLKSFREVLDLPDDDSSPVRVFHSSFPEFMPSQERVVGAFNRQGPAQESTNHGLKGEDLWVSTESLNKAHFNLCLDRMEGLVGDFEWKQDLCHLRGPGTLAGDISKTTLEESVPMTLRYACKYWASHFIATSVKENAPHHQRLLGFLRKYFLQWIETMSCLGVFNDAIRHLDRLQSHLDEFTSHETELRAFVVDAGRFVRRSKDAIQEAPLQVYSSALLFAPEESIVKQNFKGLKPSWIVNHSKAEAMWDVRLYDFADHKKTVADVKFSTDERRIASLDASGNMIVWDVATGASLWMSGGITCIEVFPSPSVAGRSMLATGAVSGEVTVWPEMKKSKAWIVEGLHKARVVKIESSADGTYLISIDAEGNVVAWDVKDNYRGQTLLPWAFLAGHGRGTSVSISDEINCERFVAISVRKEDREHREYIAVWRKYMEGRWSFVRLFPVYVGEYIQTVKLAGAFLCALVGYLTWKTDIMFIWDVRGQDEDATIEEGVAKGSTLLALPGVDYAVVVADADLFRLRRYNLGSRLEIRKENLYETETVFSESENVGIFSASSDGMRLAGVFGTGPLEGEFGLWDTDTGLRLGVSSGVNGYSTPWLSTNGGILVVVGSNRKTMGLFDCELLLQQGKHQRRWKQPLVEENDWRTRLDLSRFKVVPTISPDGTFAARVSIEDAASDDTLWVHVWNPRISQPRSHEFKLRSGLKKEDVFEVKLYFSPGNHRLAMVAGTRHSELHVCVWPLDSSTTPAPMHVSNHDARSHHFVNAAAFSRDILYLSFTCCDDEGAGRIRILDVQNHGSERPYPSRDVCFVPPDNPILNIVPLGLAGFRAAIHATLPRNEIQIVDYDYTVKAPPVQYTVGGSLRREPHLVAITSTQPTVAVLHRWSHKVDLFNITQTESKAPHATYKLPVEGNLINHDFINLCTEGSCLQTSNLGNFLLIPQGEAQVCSCETLPVCQLRDHPWLFWQGKRFLRLPTSWSSASIKVAGNLITIYLKVVSNPDTRWIELSPSIGRLVSGQTVNQEVMMREIDPKEETSSDEDSD